MEKFAFEISLSVLNHLGRNLYRSFVTVLGEAISNSWDADAKNVWIDINVEKNWFMIKDDGDGMDANDFQNKFLKIGYSKRKVGGEMSGNGRPFIGRKGIGKLALLSCADKISIISKKKGKEYVGGVIDNKGLDKAITNDLTPDQYPLKPFNLSDFQDSTKGHRSGTIIRFDGVKGGIKNRLEHIEKVIALYFRFSLVDEKFNIFLDGNKVTYKALSDLAQRTQFLWTVNDIVDPFVDELIKPLKQSEIKVDKSIHGFIASVNVPRDLNIYTMDERVSVDLFVNGRLREKNILRHIPTARLVEDYLYGQIHYNGLDEKKVDRFTSSREGILEDDITYQKFLALLKEKVMKLITDQWDTWRVQNRDDGDVENKRIAPKERKSRELYNVVSKDYTPPNDSKNKDAVEHWVDSLADDAQFNLGSYAECFISENLVRKFIQEKKMALSREANEEIKKWQATEATAMDLGNVSIKVRKTPSELTYLGMPALVNFVDKDKEKRYQTANLVRDAATFKPMRDAVAHTALLTTTAKARLTAVYENIKARVKKLLEV